MPCAQPKPSAGEHHGETQAMKQEMQIDSCRARSLAFSALFPLKLPPFLLGFG